MATFRIFIFAGISFLFSMCTQKELKDEVTNQALEELLEIFTERRIELNLHANSIPSNKELFTSLAREFSLNPEKALSKLKERYPHIYSALFQKEN